MTKFFNILLLLWSISCFSSFAQISKKNKFIKGNVDQIIQKKYDVNYKKGVFAIEYKNDPSSDIFNYNDQNILTNAEYLDHHGEVYWCYKSTFDDAGNVLTDSIFVQGKLNSIFVYKLIDQQNEESNYYDFNGEIKDIQLRTFEGEDLIKMTNMDHNRNVVSTIEYENLEGFPVKEVKKSSSGKLLEKTTYQRDRFGNIIEEEVFKNDKLSITYYAYEYDKKGNWVRKYYYSEVGLLIKVETRNIIYADDKKKMTKNDIVGNWFIYGMEKDGFVFNEDQTFYLQGHPEKTAFWSFNQRKKQLILTENKERENEMIFECALNGEFLSLAKKEIGKEIKLETRPSIIDNQFTLKMMEKPFYGKWRQVDNNQDFIQFLPDNVVFIIDENKEPQKGYWHFDFDNVLLYIKEEGKKEEKKYHYFFEENRLKLVDPDLRKEMDYEKVGQEVDELN